MNTPKTLLKHAALIGSLLSMGTALAQETDAATSPPAEKPAEATTAVNAKENSKDEGKETDRVRLDTVVVSASGFQQHITDAPASISVVSTKDITTHRVDNLADALQGVEGIDVDSRVGKTGNPTISIRGMPSDYTLVLMDGRRQNAAANVTPNGFGETSTAFMPPANAIERIEVVRGPMSTLYGSDAIGGVVNIITKKVTDEWNANVSYESTIQSDNQYGNRYGTSLYTSGPVIKEILGLTLRGSYLKREASNIFFTDNNGNKVPVYGTSATGEAQGTRGYNAASGEIWTLGGRLDLLASEDHNVWADIDFGRQTYDNSNSGLGTLDTPTNARGYKKDMEFNRDQYAIGWDGNFDNVGKLTTSFMYNSTETLGRTIPTAAVPLGNPYAGKDRILESDSYVFDAKFLAPLGESHLLTIGTQYWYAEMQDGITIDTATGDIPTMDGQQWSGFAEDEWTILPSLTLTAGLRYDYHDVVGDNISPRGYLVWKAHDYWTLKGGVSRGFKTPAINSFYDGVVGAGGQGTSLTYGNPELKPETTTSGELGFIFDNQEDISFGATAFYTDFDDKISTRSVTPPLGVTSATQYYNADDAKAYGAELFAKYIFITDGPASAIYTCT